MPTMKDIAKRAGVSHGTVSNVLNGRGNVSAEKIQLVEQAARELGYQLNSQARQLRSGVSKNVCVIVPRIDIRMYNQLYIGIQQELQKEDYNIELFCSNGLQYFEGSLLNKALSSNPEAVVMVSSLYKNKEIVPKDTRVIMVDRYVKGFPKNSVFLSFDYGKAGKEIAEKCVEDGNRSIAILCEDLRYSNNKKFVEGASEVFESEGCYFEVFASADSMKLNRAFDVLYAAETYDAVIAMSEEDMKSIEMAHRYNPSVKMPQIYGVANKEFGIENEPNRYEMNYKLLGRRIAEMIRENSFEGNNLEGITEGHFCAVKKCSVQKKETLRYLTVKNTTSQAISRLVSLFTEQTGIEVKVIEVPYEELQKMITKMGVDHETVYDLVRIDMAWMSQEGERIFRKLDVDDPRMKGVLDKILPCIPKEYFSLRGEKYAIPLDACVQMLFCRKDLFENELLKREFYETYRRKLEIPRTFEEYNRAARFFTQKYNKQSPTIYGTTLTYGRSFVAAIEILPRYFEKNDSFFDDNGKVKINTEEMAEAFRSCMDACNYTSSTPHFWWSEASRMFSDGLAAMNIAFSNYAADMVHNTNSKVAGKIIYAGVPGGNPLLGGGSVGITKSSKKVSECCRFIEWLYSDEISEMITYLGGFIANKSIINNANVLELYPWIGEIEEIFSKGRRGAYPESNTDFDEFAFEDILGSSFMAVVSGADDIYNALNEAQKICDRMFN